MFKDKNIRISLDGDDFLTLIRGGILTIKQGDNQVQLMLKDIGFDVMHDLIDYVSDPYNKEQIYKNLERDVEDNSGCEHLKVLGLSKTT